MPDHVILGFGNAGYHAARAIRERDRRSPIHVYSDVDLPPSNPMLTTYFVKGTLDYPQLFPHGTLEDIGRALDLRFHGNCPAAGVDPAARAVLLRDGSRVPYDKLLVATGASAFVPGAPGMDLPGVLPMRTAADALRLRELLAEKNVGSVLVVGASMVGIKIVELARLRDIPCTLVDGAPYMFPLAAFPNVAARIQDALTAQGVSLAFSALLSSIEETGAPWGGGRLRAVMKDGSAYTADLIAVCIGTRASTAVVRDSGVAVNKGILVDRHMRTNFPDIYAAGDCCEGYELQSGERRVIGLWANAGYQGRTAGLNMAGGDASFDFTMLHNISHFLGMDFLGMGDVSACRESAGVYEHDGGGVYLKAVKGADGRVACINLLGGATLGGVLKNRLMKTMEGAPPPDDDLLACALTDAGVPLDFIDFLGGERDVH